MLQHVNSVAITSSQNRWVKMIRAAARGNREPGFYVAEGLRCVNELCKTYEPLALLCAASEFSKLQAQSIHPILSVQDELWLQLSNLISQSPLIGIFAEPHTTMTELFESKPQRLLILDGIQDPGNLGTILRTAAAASWSGIICVQGTTDAFAPKVIRATAGMASTLKIVKAPSVDELKLCLNEHKYNLLLACSNSGENARDIASIADMPVALVLGAEGCGLRTDWSTGLEIRYVCLECEVESLNVAIAGAILMYKLAGLI